MKALFVCTANIQRSLTAEHVCRTLHPKHQFKSAGVSKKECARNNSTLCSIELLNWADKVFVFEGMHAQRIVDHTGTKFADKLINLDIPDTYQYADTELVETLKAKMSDYF